MDGPFPEWTWIVGFYIGAAIGSFLNVVIYRMPRGLSLAEPAHSFCPSCRHRLGWKDLFPLFSWIFQRGKCRYCKVSIPARYLSVEIITGALFGAFWYQNFSAGNDLARGVILPLFAACCVAAIFIDLKFYIIPDQINAAMFGLGIALNVVLILQHKPDAMTWGMPSAIAGALAGIGALWGIALLGRLIFKKDAMGHGDIKMARGIGAVLFPVAALMSFAVAVALGAMGGILQILWRRKEEEASGDDEDWEEEPPESIGSLLKCGLGYVLCMDIWGLFRPKLYESWFGENPYAVEVVEEEDFQVGATMIPFGPYLAAGALVLALFEPHFREWLDAYVKGITGM